ncbi:MAG: phosphopyruvate hydratase [Candidatus Kerfeldbacteria bacterium]|nr:phosphopyruvate hydratase [Candidatus Kerfeldbacteria bacterium]
MSITIKDITAREILDSRGDPTVEVTAMASNGAAATASVPSGASTGIHEAHELRDGDKNRYEGKGVLQAVAHIESEIKQTLIGMQVTNQSIIDQRMIELDGTTTKHSLGANAILGVSLAVARLGALVNNLPLYSYLRQVFSLPLPAKPLPLPMMNILNGGRHASNDLDIQEFIIIPHLGVKADLSLKDSIRVGSEIFHELGRVLHQKKFSTDVGNEGGYAPSLKNNEQALGLIIAAVKQSGYSLAKDVDLGLDVAASEFYKSGKYHFEGKDLSVNELIKIYQSWQDNYQLFSIEDGLAEDDWQGWHQLTEDLGNQVLLVGDDLFVTNKERLALGAEFKAANAILIKPNQIGSLSETVACVLAARRYNYKVVVSHRSGETMDTFIVDLAVAVGADYLKAGSTSRGERVAKYNRLMEIEAERKSSA